MFDVIEEENMILLPSGKDLNGVVHALSRVVEDEAGIGNVGVEQLVLRPAGQYFV